MKSKHTLYAAKPGDYYAVELPDGFFGYVRIHRGSALGVLPVYSTGLITSPEPLLAHEPEQYFEFLAPSSDSAWMVRIGFRQFFDPADPLAGFAPPRWIPPSIFHGFYEILEHGLQHRTTEAETHGLQRRETLTPTSLRNFISEHQSAFQHINSNASGSA